MEPLLDAIVSIRRLGLVNVSLIFDYISSLFFDISIYIEHFKQNLEYFGDRLQSAKLSQS